KRAIGTHAQSRDVAILFYAVAANRKIVVYARRKIMVAGRCDHAAIAKRDIDGFGRIQADDTGIAVKSRGVFRGNRGHSYSVAGAVLKAHSGNDVIILIFW